MKKYTDLVYHDGYDTAGRLDVYLPDHFGKNTLLIYFHGGGIEVGDKADEADIYEILADNGIACVSANYRMYPNAKFPQFVEDAADVIAWSLSQVPKLAAIQAFERVFIGGISAGAYLSMMLHFSKEYLQSRGVDETKICGYIFDSGQPTVHYNILRERGEDTGSIRVDEAAPIWYVNQQIDPVLYKQRYLFLVSDHDMPCRKEQNEMLMCSMLMHGYQKEQIEYRVMEGFEHVGYVHVRDDKGNLPYAEWLLGFLQKGNI